MKLTPLNRAVVMILASKHTSQWIGRFILIQRNIISAIRQSNSSIGINKAAKINQF